ncbi:MAG: ribonuclease HII [Chlamydiota bacterium]|nr:ribonuclease HII [Chlamydiota bacterium]
MKLDLIAGIDEAGRGPLAGPVVAAACAAPKGYPLPPVGDSKRISPAKREEAFHQLYRDPQIMIGVGIIPSNRIDHINILEATMEAMALAFDHLAFLPSWVIVDGLHFPPIKSPGQALPRADADYSLVGAASIIAKVRRDQLMQEAHSQWPEYGFDRHKGYPTALHLARLGEHGPSPCHRRSFAPVKRVICPA